MRISVDMDRCENHGQCVFAAPSVFAFDDDDYLTYEPSPDGAVLADVLQAARACPVRAITVAQDAA